MNISELLNHKNMIIALARALGPRTVSEKEYIMHIPQNWTGIDIKILESMSIQGLPLLSVPNTILSELELSDSYKNAITKMLAKDKAIIDSCSEIIKTISSTNYRKHFAESIKAYELGLFRASQSASIVILDSKMEDLFDFSNKGWRRQGKDIDKSLAYRTVNYITTEIFKDEVKLPLNNGVPFYSILCARVLFKVFAVEFKIGNKNAWHKIDTLNRPMGAHTVSGLQYKKANALLAIMLISDLFIIESKYAKHWLEKLVREYNLVEESSR